jgi:amino acid transporter
MPTRRRSSFGDLRFRLLVPCSGYDSAVHISEEASNAARAVPLAIVGAISVAALLGTAIMIVLAFCMGSDLDSILGSSVGQPVCRRPHRSVHH